MSIIYLIQRVIKLFLALTLAVMFFSCGNRQSTLCSSIFHKCISIIDNNNLRYIYYGEKSSGNYVKLDISKLDFEADGIFVCWNNEHNKLEIINPQSKIIEVKLDTSIYQFSNVHQVDSLGIPKVLKFHQKGNIEFNIGTKSIFPVNNDVHMSNN